MNTLNNNEILRYALIGLEVTHADIGQKVSVIKAMINGRDDPAQPANAPPAVRKRHISPAARKRMAEAQHKRRENERMAVAKAAAAARRRR